MTNGNIETRVFALERQMEQIQSTLQQVASLQVAGQQQINRFGDRMNQLGDRLVQLEQVQERTQRQLDITLNIANSNARSVQAWESQINQVEEEAEEGRSALAVRLTDLEQASRENIAQHFHFQERFDQTLAEIQRIWQRLAG